MAHMSKPIDPASVRALSKIELHCHIEGTMRPTTAADLARAAGIQLPVEDPVELYDYDDLTGFLKVFWLIQSVLADAEAWERLAYESVVDASADGLVHREAFFTPARLLASGQELGDIVAALDRGLAAGEAATGVTTRLILDMDRDFGPHVGLDHVEQLARLRRSRSPGAERVIGVGMDSTELGVDPATYVAAYRAAAAVGLRRTAHQGENSAAAAIGTAIDVLGCERIDHGISVLGDAELTARLAEYRIPLTVCPNANVRINPDVVADIADHPFPAMRAAGLLVTLNTDDPGLVGLDLTAELLLSAEAFGYDWDDLVAIVVDGVEASWLDDSERPAMRDRILASAAGVGRVAV